MFRKYSKHVRRLAVVAVFAVIAVATLGFAASNTVPTSKAGDGNNTISGYTVSAVHYNLNASNPQNIDSVSFTLDSAPVAGSTVKVKLVASGSTWYSCTMTGAAATCTSGGATVATADELSVVVAD